MDDILVVGQMHCSRCGARYLSVWPANAEVLAFECQGCGDQQSRCAVAYPLHHHQGLQGLVHFHHARRALRLRTLVGASWH
jgi:hypothetical protein